MRVTLDLYILRITSDFYEKLFLKIYLAVNPRGESTLTAAWNSTENTNQ